MAKILIVDDEPLNRELLVSLLGSNQHQVLEASDGEEALSIARTQGLDLIITDALMPTMDGCEFIRRLRADATINHTRVIFVADHYLSREARALAETFDVGYVIFRPFDKDEILRIVGATLQIDLPRESLRPSNRTDFDREHLQLLTDKLSDKVDELTAFNLKLTTLIELSQQTSAEHDPISLLKRYTHVAREIIGSKWNALILFDNDTRTFQQCYSVGLNSDIASRVRPQSLHKSALFTPPKDGRPCRIRILNGDTQAAGLPSDFPALSSCLLVPIMLRGELYGSFCLGDKLGAVEFSETDEQLAVTLVWQLVVALENATLFVNSKLRALELERKAQLTLQFERQQLRLENIIANVPGVVWETWLEPNAANQQVNYVSDQIEPLLGYRVEDWLRTPDFWLTIVHPEDRERVAQFSAAHFATGEGYSQEFRWVAVDGRIVWVESQVSIICDAHGKPVGWRGISLDITEKKVAKEALHVSEEQLRQSLKLEAIGQLAGGVAHDFNNLLTVITGYSELALRRLDMDSPVRPGIEEIKKAGARAASLTRQLLAFSRKQVLQPKVLELNTIVADVDMMLQRLIGKDVDLFTSLEPFLGQIKADPGQIEHVIINLVVNARDAMPQGGKITIETANVELDDNYARNHVVFQPGQYVMLAVSDTGCGMDVETQSRIFDPFYTTKVSGKGTGLGLSTVYGVVKQSGGYVWVYSEINKGTTFKIYLPRIEVAITSEIASESHYEILRGSEMVLLVEDEEQVLRMTRGILEMNGYTVLEASNGADALVAFQEYEDEIDLIVTDVVMPQMGGRELVENVRQRSPGMRVLYMSGYTDDAIVHHGFLDQDVSFLQKPFTPEALARKVREVLDKAPLDPNTQGSDVVLAEP